MRQLAFYFLLLLLSIQGNSFAQTVDQRAENIQNGTNTIFMSADRSFYYGNNNRNNDPYGYGYWITAHTLEGLADAYQRTRNPVYRDRMKSILAGIRKYNLYAAGTYRNDYYDDLEWLCLAAFNCYNATKDPEFLTAVHQIWAEIKTGYTNGAMSWRKGCTTPCKNSIANSPAIIIAVKLYQLEGDNANLQMAKDLHAWMKATVFNAQGGIWDAPNNFNPDWQFSYNSGMFIGACLELAVVTGSQSYIDDGIKASEFMMNYRYYNGGVFFLNEKGQGDGGLFKGIFAKYFTDFVRIGNLTQMQKERYLKVINYTADYAWANSVNKSNFLIGPDWSALPSGTIDLSTQTSGVHLFEAAACLNKVHVYQNINYSGFYSQLPLGSFTLAQLQARGISDNDITSLTIPNGFTVTVYENDNFTGASKTFTSNTGWLADWNDRITSVRIADARTSVVTAFQDVNFGGYSAGLDIGNYTLAQLQSRGIKDNDITSFKIGAGFKVTVYDGDNFTGATADFTSDNGWLADWNDRISSIKVIDVRPYSVHVFQDVNFGGYSAGFNVGDYTLAQLQAKGVRDNDITSLKIVPGFKATVYENDNFTGASMDFTSDVGWTAEWNDRATSLRVSPVGINGTGDGLTANYFNGRNFETPVYSRKDATVNFNWNAGSPDASVAADGFSARWTGQIQPRYSGVYTFYVNSDNGRRLWINNQLIIDKWIDDWGVEYSGAITLTAGQKYDIKLEYFENNGGANCKLEWSSPSQAREVVPQSQLYSNTLPTISITSPITNQEYNAPASVTINATAADAGGSISKVDFYHGSTFIGSDNSSPYSFTWTSVAAGTYSITSRATDNLGGVTASAAVSIKVNAVVNQLPSVSITSPANNASFTAPATIAITATASDADGSITKVEFFNGAQKLGEDAIPPYNYSWAGVAVGTYTLTAKATDNSGGNTTSASVTVTVVAPASVGSVYEHCNFGGYAVNLAPGNYTASQLTALGSKDNDISSVKVQTGYRIILYAEDNFLGSSLVITSDNSCVVGNGFNDIASSIKVEAVTANNPPSVSITSPVNNATYNAPASITINANAADADGTISKVDFYNGSTLLGSDNAAPYSFTWKNVSAGTYTIVAKATDNNSAITTSAGVSVIVNTVVVNQAPTVNLTSPANNSSFTAPATISISANASDADGSIAKVEFFNGSQTLGEDVSAPYSYSWTGVAAGTYNIIAKATDNLGAATTSASISITVIPVTTDNCSNVPQYVENSGYVAASKTKNGDRLYECKAWPYSGWCNGAAWAYAPGSGAYWQDAWYDKGACTAAKMASGNSASLEAEAISIAPNPVMNELVLQSDMDLSGGKIRIFNSLGVELLNVDAGSSLIDVSSLASGIYTMVYSRNDRIITRQFVK